MTTFTPTHRTNRPIGKIEAGSLIRVVQYNSTGSFAHTLGQLGVSAENIGYVYLGEDVEFWDRRDGDRALTSRFLVDNDYVITDGEYVESSYGDSGWDLLTKQQPEGVSLSSWGSGLYTLRGDAGGEIRLAASQLYDLIKVIQNRVPKPSPIKDAQFIRARTKGLGEFRVLAKIDDLWYDHISKEYTEDQVLDIFDEIEVIR